MNVITCRHYEELSEKAASIIAETVKQKPDAVLGLATGGTPEGVYKELVRMHRSEGLSFRNVTTINLDEYAGLSPEDKNSYHYYMNTHFFGCVRCLKAVYPLRRVFESIGHSVRIRHQDRLPVRQGESGGPFGCRYVQKNVYSYNNDSCFCPREKARRIRQG